MRHPLFDRLVAGAVLCDGAMGTFLYGRGIPYNQCYEKLNVDQPDMIQAIHQAYIAAGAEIIETNTFGANRFRLATHGLSDKVRELNIRGAKVAREARDISGAPVLVAGSIGPLGLNTTALSPDQMRAAFQEQVEALLEGGVDFVLIETMIYYPELLAAVAAARGCCDLPIVAQASFSEEGTIATGESAAEVAAGLIAAGASVIGANCNIGPQGTLEMARVMRGSAAQSGREIYVSAQPNAGAPSRVDGRMFYISSPDYFGGYVPRFVEAGVGLIGGCCGTTPEHIAAMRAALGQDAKGYSLGFDPTGGHDAGLMYAPPHAGDDSHSTSGVPEHHHDDYQTLAHTALSYIENFAETPPPTSLKAKIDAGKFVVSVELAPPRGINPTKMLQGAAMVRDAGADCVNITDSAMAKVRMSSVGCAQLVQRIVGIETIIHYTSRDRNLMALQSDLLGAHANNVRNVLALTGDPPRMGDYPGAKGIWDVDSIGLVGILNSLNEGRDWNGTSIGTPASFGIGCAANPTATDLPLEIERVKRKIAAGAHFIMTQPVFSKAVLLDFLDALGDQRVPVLVGITPLHNYKHAEYLYNEVPGIVVTKEALERMRAAGEHGFDAGLAIARDLLAEVRPYVQGLYVLPSHNKYEAAAELVRTLRHSEAVAV